MSDTPAPQAAHAAEPSRDPAAPEREARVRLLLSRLAASPDLPSLSESVRTIQKILRTDRAHLRSLSDEILQDVALSSKLLRLVSAAFYRSAGGDSVDSISRAVSLLGFDALSRLAGSMKLFDRLPASMVGTRVQAEFARALLAAIAAHELHPSLKEGELVYLSGLFQNLGRMLVWMHFPQEAERIMLQAESDLAEASPEGEDTAARQCRRNRLEDRHAEDVLGLGLEDLGAEIARMWGWPESMQRALRPMMPEDYAGSHPGEDRIRLVASLGNQLASVIVETPQEALDEALAAFQVRWRMFLGDDPKPFQALLGRVERQWSVLAPVTRVAEAAAFKPRRADPPARPGAPAPAQPQAGWPVFSMAGALLRQREVPRAASPSEEPEDASPRPGRRQRLDPAEVDVRLTQGLEKLREAAGEGGNGVALLEMAMQTLLHALQAQRVAVCLRDAASGQLLGRMGAGAGMPRMLVNFTVQPAGGADLYALACSKGLDTLIDDSKRPTTWRNLPVWYRRRVAAPCFLLLPLRNEDACIGLIYVDHDEPGGLTIDAGQMQLIQALRAEVVQGLLRRTLRAQPA
ncbi:MAG: HDOD domain-containing protein [Rubrivivax sp.]